MRAQAKIALITVKIKAGSSGAKKSKENLPKGTETGEQVALSNKRIVDNANTVITRQKRNLAVIVVSVGGLQLLSS